MSLQPIQAISTKRKERKGETARKNRRRDRGIEVPFMLNDQNPAQILKKGQPEDIALWKAKKYSCSWFSFSSVRNHNPETFLLGRLQSYLSPVESSTFPGVGIDSEMQICKIDVELSLCLHSSNLLGWPPPADSVLVFLRESRCIERFRYTRCKHSEMWWRPWRALHHVSFAFRHFA